jgi:hypothetical protein
VPYADDGNGASCDRVLRGTQRSGASRGAHG